MKQVTCHSCKGTGVVTEYEQWEWALRSMAMYVDFAERHAAARGTRLVSLDVEGSYPVAVIVERWEDDLDVVEREMTMWPMRQHDVRVHPLNVKGGNYEPVDPRFYE